MTIDGTVLVYNGLEMFWRSTTYNVILFPLCSFTIIAPPVKYCQTFKYEDVVRVDKVLRRADVYGGSNWIRVVHGESDVS